MKGKQSNSLPLFRTILPIWLSNSGPQSDIIISTRVRLARNLINHKFTYHATRSERKKIFDSIAAIFASHKEFASYSLANCALISPVQQQILLEERLISPDLLTIEGERGVAIEKTRHTSIMINEEDHLRLNSIDSGFQAEEVWSRINFIDDLLGKYLPYAYDSRRGFLTSCPTNSGTGLRISFLLHLPALFLTKTIDSVLLGASQMGISTRGFSGEHSEIVGNIFQLSNQATLGSCEEEFLNHTRTTINEVVQHERTARERILSNAAAELTDKVFRAWGILLYARMVTTSEFLNLASALRLGIDAGIFKEITIDQLNRMTLISMPGHLQAFLKKTITEEQFDFERADAIRAFIASEKSKKKPEKKNPKKRELTNNLPA